MSCHVFTCGETHFQPQRELGSPASILRPGGVRSTLSFSVWDRTVPRMRAVPTLVAIQVHRAGSAAIFNGYCNACANAATLCPDWAACAWPQRCRLCPLVCHVLVGIAHAFFHANTMLYGAKLCLCVQVSRALVVVYGNAITCRLQNLGAVGGLWSSTLVL